MKLQSDLGNDKIVTLVLSLAAPTMIAQFVNVMYSIVDRMYNDWGYPCCGLPVTLSQINLFAYYTASTNVVWGGIGVLCRASLRPCGKLCKCSGVLLCISQDNAGAREHANGERTI